MNRRGFLGNMIAGAAAVLGAGMVQPAEASTVETLPTLMPGQRWEIGQSSPPAPVDHTDLVQGYIDRGEIIPAGEYNISRSLRARGGIAGSGPSTVLKWIGGGDGEAVVVADGPGFVASGVLIDGSGRAHGVMVGAQLADSYASGYNRGMDIGEAACADCDRVFALMPVPAMFAQPFPAMIGLARQATHEKAVREAISHDEAALATYWSAFPEMVIETDAEAMALTAGMVVEIADLEAAVYNRGLDIGEARGESRAALGLPVTRSEDLTEARYAQDAWDLAYEYPTPLNVAEAERLMNRATALVWAGDPDAELPDIMRASHPGPTLALLRRRSLHDA